MAEASRVEPIDKAKKKRERQKLEAKLLKKQIEFLPEAEYDHVVTVIEEHNIFEQASKLLPSHDNEISELLCRRFELHPSEAIGFRKAIQELREESRPRGQRGRRRPDYACFDEYKHLFERELGVLKRDIFSGDLMWRCPARSAWLPVINEAPRLTAVADEWNIKWEDKAQFKSSMVRPYLMRMEAEATPEVVPTIPQWDGQDRIRLICDCLKMDGSQPAFTSEVVEAIIKHWCAGVWRKIRDPKHQNPLLILIGNQGIGKDWVIDALTGAFGQWSHDFSVFANERDTLEQLNGAAVLRISEFDRTSRTSVALLKHLISADHTRLRSAYDPRGAYRPARASFVSSCNIHDIYRDHTGHRRFLPLNIASIGWDYPRGEEDKLQIVAQGMALADDGYSMDSAAKEVVKVYLESQTPSDPEDDALDAWDLAVSTWINKTASVEEKSAAFSRGWLTNADIQASNLMNIVCKRLGWKEKRLRELLRRKGFARRTKWEKGYAARAGALGEELETVDSDEQIDF